MIEGQNLLDQVAKNDQKIFDNIQKIQQFKEMITLAVVCQTSKIITT